jgi:hypothetical protein
MFLSRKTFIPQNMDKNINFKSLRLQKAIELSRQKTQKIAIVFGIKFLLELTQTASISIQAELKARV